MKEDRNNKNSIVMKLLFGMLTAICVIVVGVFVYVLALVSLQTGETSAQISKSMSYRLGAYLLEDYPTTEQMEAINRLLRYVAHIIFFFLLAFLLGIVLFLIVRSSVGRLLSILAIWAISFGLSYLTEYVKKFIDGRHCQLEDIKANMFGSLLGLCFFLVCLGLFEAIHVRAKKS